MHGNTEIKLLLLNYFSATSLFFTMKVSSCERKTIFSVHRKCPSFCMLPRMRTRGMFMSVPWLIGTEHFPESKNTSQNPKKRPRIQKRFQKSKNTFWNPKALPRTKCFWILGSFGFFYICNLGGPFYCCDWHVKNSCETPVKSRPLMLFCLSHQNFA